MQNSLDKIKSLDQAGYALNSVLAVSESALAEAIELDKRNSNLPLNGLPILIKDNIEARGLPATAGSLALADTPVTHDSTIAANCNTPPTRGRS